MRSGKLTRRNVLRGSAGIAVALPFLESLPSARAADSEAPLRYLGFMHPQGTLVGEWTPTETGSDYTLPAILSPLESVRDSVVVVSGVDNPAAGLHVASNGHVSSGRSIFTAAGPSPISDFAPFADGPSIDQVIAERIAAPTPYRSLQFGIGGSDVGEYQALYAGPGDPVPLDHDPASIFDLLFTDFQVGEPPTPSAAQRLRARRQSVLDAVRDNFTSLQNRVSASDRIRLEAHADKIRQLEQQVGGTGDATLSCEIPQLEIPAGYDSRNDSQDDISSRLLTDLMVMAIACDLTRVGTLQYTNYHGPRYEWLGQAIPGPYDQWHAMVHDIPNANDLTAARAVFTWYMEELAYLVDQLSQLADAGGTTLLDNMIVYSVSELGDGASHATNRLPVVLAGGACGQLETGRHVRADGGRIGELYVSFLNMFGAPDTSFGEPGLCSGPLDLS